MGTLLRTVEAAYRLASPDTEWLRDLSRGLSEAWGVGGVGGLGARYRWPERGSIEVLDIANAGLAPEIEASIVEAAGVATQSPALRMLYRGLHVATMTQRFEEHQGDFPPCSSTGGDRAQSRLSGRWGFTNALKFICNFEALESGPSIAQW